MIPNQLCRPEFRFCLIRPRDKRPFELDWQKINNYIYSDSILETHIKKGGNYGIICGYGNLLVIDFDNLDIQNKIEPDLPKTFTVKTGSGLHHKYFICDKTESIKILTKEKDTLVDIQGMGKQIISPGSIHPNGNLYEIIDDSPIAIITMAEIKALFSKYKDFDRDFMRQKKVFNKDKTIDEIKEKRSVVEQLRKYGVDISKSPTACPFHESKAGKCLSFKEDLWHCFHCEGGGDIINLVMKHDNLSFVKAKNKLCDELNIKKSLTSKRNNLDIYENVEDFSNEHPFFFDDNKIFWFWNLNECKWEIVDDVTLINAIEEEFGVAGEIVTGSLLGKYMRSFEAIGRKKKPKEAPKHWIQFKDKIFDLKTKETFEASSEWFLCNPIPYEIGKNDETPTIDNLFLEWVGEKHKQTLYEILAYCCLCDYPIHSLFCFIGAGRNGKSRFLALLNKFIGASNCISTELDALTDSRFESAKLYKKSVCFMGETNFGILEKTSIIKKLTGQDLLGGEFKGKNPFDFVNYAKLCISSNSLPSSSDTSEGFYRRWMIIDFPNQFNEGKDILETIPEIEYNNLASKVIGLLPVLLHNGCFTNQGSIEDRKKKYIMASNPISLFLNVCCELEINNYARYADLYVAYLHYLQINKRRSISRKEFSKVLEAEGYVIEKKNINYESGYYVLGVSLKSNWKEAVTDVTNVMDILLREKMKIGLVDKKEGNNNIERSETIVTSNTSVTNNNQNLNVFINEERFIDKFITFLEQRQPYESVINFLNESGFKKEEAERFIDLSKSQGVIFEPTSGYLETLK